MIWYEQRFRLSKLLQSQFVCCTTKIKYATSLGMFIVNSRVKNSKKLTVESPSRLDRKGVLDRLISFNKLLVWKNLSNQIIRYWSVYQPYPTLIGTLQNVKTKQSRSSNLWFARNTDKCFAHVWSCVIELLPDWIYDV